MPVAAGAVAAAAAPGPRRPLALAEAGHDSDGARPLIIMMMTMTPMLARVVRPRLELRVWAGLAICHCGPTPSRRAQALGSRRDGPASRRQRPSLSPPLYRLKYLHPYVNLDAESRKG